ncbi:hypothetical protein PoB_003447700 [Plakobranchus ocellatus]|uniref:Uncharacterized protein n=1 Tax=Plakobranchus ocellatus TaxID=259542 RepID=A0AAV4AL57_9GAST|nr:hypothetical protein PoB_003447700 [Plakobranchus ocellatus]
MVASTIHDDSISKRIILSGSNPKPRCTHVNFSLVGQLIYLQHRLALQSRIADIILENVLHVKDLPTQPNISEDDDDTPNRRYHGKFSNVTTRSAGRLEGGSTLLDAYQSSATDTESKYNSVSHTNRSTFAPEVFTEWDIRFLVSFDPVTFRADDR